MTWKLDSDRPIYAQLLEQIQMQIVSGQYPSGSKLPSVRELAAHAGVNPNTMQKAFAEDTLLIQNIRQSLAREQLAGFFQNMRQLGYQKEEILSFLKATYEEG